MQIWISREVISISKKSNLINDYSTTFIIRAICQRKLEWLNTVASARIFDMRIMKIVIRNRVLLKILTGRLSRLFQSCRWSGDNNLLFQRIFVFLISALPQQVLRTIKRLDSLRTRMIPNMTENEIVEFYQQTLSSVSRSRKKREKNFTSSRKKYYKMKRKLQCILEYRIRQDIYKRKFSLPSQVFLKMIDMITGSTETAL